MTGSSRAAAQFERIARRWGTSPAPAAAGSRVQVVDGPWPVLQLQVDDGRWVTANSSRAPVAEAHSWLTGFDATKGSALVVVGLGLGYVLEALDEQGHRPMVIGLEPDPAIVTACLGRRDWSGWIDDGRLLLSAAPDFAELSTLATRAPDLLVSPACLVHPVMQREYADFVRDALDRVGRARAGAEANATARQRFAGPYLVNTLCNLPAIERAADVDALEGIADGLPAIVVGAGPSLDRTIDQLRRADERAVVIATDTAARPLLDAGLRPHAIVSVDPTALNGRHLRDLFDSGATALVAEASLWPSALAAFDDRTFLFRVAPHDPWPWLDAAGLAVGHLRAWGSVITSAVDLAVRMGCRPIVLTGADCAATGGQPYARGTTFEALWAERVLQGISLPEFWARNAAEWTGAQDTDLDGRAVATGVHLVAFRDWLVEEGRTHPGLLVNASGQGLLHGRGVAQMTLKDALDTFGAPTGDLRARIAERHRRSCAERHANRKPRPAPPLDSWSSVVTASGIAPDVLDKVLAQGPGAWVDREAERAEILVSPPAEAIALLRAHFGGGVPPDWASSTAWQARVPPVNVSEAGAGLDAILREPFDDCDALAANVRFVASRSPGLSAPRRAWLARLETIAASLLATHVRSSSWAFGVPAQSDLPMIGPAPVRGATVLGHPFKTAVALQYLSILLVSPDVIPTPGDRSHARVARLLHRTASDLASGGPKATPIDATPVDVVIRCDEDARLSATLPLSGADLARAMIGTVIGELASPATLRYALDVEIVRQPRLRAYATLTAVDRAGRSFTPMAQLEPLHLSPSSLPPCFIARTEDDEHAALPGLLQRETYRVTPDGRAFVARRWPHPILGELPWGEGGALAWVNKGPRDAWRVMWRRTPEADVHETPLPFRPAAATVHEGTVYFSSMTGGLWRWTPEGGAVYLVDTPVIYGLAVDGARLRLDPVYLAAAGHTTRLRLDRAYLWTPGTSALEPVALGETGACWSVARGRHGWTARAYATTSIVEVVSPSGRAFGLVCPFPFSVAWAGTSLVVVSTTAGEVLLFEQLVRRLEELEGRGRGSIRITTRSGSG